MQCPQCQHANRDTAKFCEDCGARLIHLCFHCGHDVSSQAKFCEECGASLTGSVATNQPESHESDAESRFQALLPVVIGLLRGKQRITYRTLKYALSLDNTLLEEIRKELTFRQLVRDEVGEGLVWTGEALASDASIVTVAPSQPASVETSVIPSDTVPAPLPLVTPAASETKGSTTSPEVPPTDVSSDKPVVVPEPIRAAPDAERRQLTVMFCDLVGSTELSGKLDPEDLREVVRAYQQTAAEVIERYEGHIAQYLGDGLLIYFGWPQAHENDAERAVFTGLGITEAIATLNTRLAADNDVQLAVRIGIHTGPVVVGEMGGGNRHENLALGETPNIAARLEGLAQPNTSVISPVTAQLVQRSFVLEEFGPHELKGVVEPMRLWRVVGLRETVLEAAGTTGDGFEVLVGRDEEIGLLLRRWQQSQDGLGQVVLISGEAGIGKSSLVSGLRNHVRQEGHTQIVLRCSPYHVNSALYPFIEHAQRVLGWQSDDTSETRLAKLEQGLESTSLVLKEAVPLLASLLALPLPEWRYPALTLSPQQQRQQTQDVMVAWLLEEAERRPVLAVWEDLHWADPSTLEHLSLLVEQAPTVAMLHVLTFRPEFESPWAARSHLTPLALNRLERSQVKTLITRLAGGKLLPAEVVEHIVAKTDGVPLYVEELTKMLLASDLLREDTAHYELTGPLLSIAIPDTLQDLLMARLDQLGRAKCDALITSGCKLDNIEISDSN